MVFDRSNNRFFLEFFFFLAPAVQTFCPDRRLSAGGVEQVGAYPRPRSRLGFFRSWSCIIQPGRPSHTRQGCVPGERGPKEVKFGVKEERRERMEEVVKKRPIISARERGQY